MNYKKDLIKVGDILIVSYYVPYFIKGKERLIQRNFQGLCVSRQSIKPLSEVIKLKAWFKRNIVLLSFNLNSPLLLKIKLLSKN